MDVMYKFWKDYEEADALERARIVEKTRFFERTMSMLISSLDDTEQREAFYSMLRSYFDDIIEYSRGKNNEKNI